MPVSKHRHKSGGKSVRHPGRRRVLKEDPPWPEYQAWQKYHAGYAAPFHRTMGYDHEAGYALDLIADSAWRYPGPLQPVSKAALFQKLSEPLDEEDRGKTAEESERALAYLVEHGMVEMAGDQITVPAQFQQSGKAG
jgi:hypothetical protein